MGALAATKPKAPKTLAKKRVKATKRAKKRRKRKAKPRSARRSTDMRQVYNGKRKKTRGRLVAGELEKNKTGRVVSKRQAEHGKKVGMKNLMPWLSALAEARKLLGIKGFKAPKKGTRLYATVRRIFDKKRTMRGSRGPAGAELDACREGLVSRPSDRHRPKPQRSATVDSMLRDSPPREPARAPRPPSAPASPARPHHERTPANPRPIREGHRRGLLRPESDDSVWDSLWGSPEDPRARDQGQRTERDAASPEDPRKHEGGPRTESGAARGGPPPREEYRGLGCRGPPGPKLGARQDFLGSGPRPGAPTSQPRALSLVEARERDLRAHHALKDRAWNRVLRELAELMEEAKEVCKPDSWRLWPAAKSAKPLRAEALETCSVPPMSMRRSHKPRDQPERDAALGGSPPPRTERGERYHPPESMRSARDRQDHRGQMRPAEKDSLWGTPAGPERERASTPSPAGTKRLRRAAEADEAEPEVAQKPAQAPKRPRKAPAPCKAEPPEPELPKRPRRASAEAARAAIAKQAAAEVEEPPQRPRRNSAPKQAEAPAGHRRAIAARTLSALAALPRAPPGSGAAKAAAALAARAARVRSPAVPPALRLRSQAMTVPEAALDEAVQKCAAQAKAKAHQGVEAAEPRELAARLAKEQEEQRQHDAARLERAATARKQHAEQRMRSPVPDVTPVARAANTQLAPTSLALGAKTSAPEIRFGEDAAAFVHRSGQDPRAAVGARMQARLTPQREASAGSAPRAKAGKSRIGSDDEDAAPVRGAKRAAPKPKAKAKQRRVDPRVCDPAAPRRAG